MAAPSVPYIPFHQPELAKSVVTNAAVPAVGPPVWTVMVPPAPDKLSAVPSGRAPRAFVTEIGTEALLVGVRVTVTIATTPLVMMVEFIPEMRHERDCAPAEQVTVLPVAVAAGPAVTATEAISLAE